MLQFDPKELHFSKVHQLLLGAIGPRPIAFASTVDAEGNNNLSPFSFFNVFSANPPLLIFSPARNGRTNTTKNTYDNVKVIPEVVINIVNFDIVEQMSLASSPYPKDVDEFVEAGFTALDSDTIRPKRVGESPVQIECKVTEVKELGTEGGAGNLIFCEVLKIHVREDLIDENGQIDQRKINLVARMGGNFYCHANEHALFEIAKPITTVGVGFTKIPEDIRQSVVLTGNDLGKLAGILEIPDETRVNDYKLMELSDVFMEHEDDAVVLERTLHELAKAHLENNEVEEAWMTLLSFND